MTHVLVTGGAGFVGRTVVRTLLADGAAVRVADLKPFEGPGAADVEMVVGDLRDPDVQRRAVTSDISAIVHLAALTSVLQSVKDPDGTYTTNVAMTAGLLERAREADVDRFVFASTNAVVGDVGEAPIHEGLALSPLTPYGATKAAAEMLLSAYVHAYGMAAVSLRLTNVYGGGMGHKDSFVPRLMRAARTGSAVNIYGDGRQRRDFVHVTDVAAAVMTALRDRWSGPVVIGSGRSVSVLELVDEVRRVTDTPLEAVHVAPKPGEMPAVIVRTDRAHVLGWHPQVDLPEGLAGVWEEFHAPERDPVS